MGEQSTENLASGYVDGHGWDGQGEFPVSKEVVYNGLRAMRQNFMAAEQADVAQQSRESEA